MCAQLQKGFRVGEYNVYPLEGRIVGPDSDSHLQPKVMEVLVRLAEKPAQVVGRDDLLQSVWGTTDVAADVLTRCISELRHELGDHPDAPHFIQTIPKRGYRLVAAVRRLDGTPFQSSNGTGPAKRTEEESDSLLEALKRRRVARVGIAYAVVAWLIIQVADSTFPALFLPDWSVTLVIVLMILGFPIAIVLSWILQLTPDGLVLDRPASANPAVRRKVYLTFAVAAIAGAGILFYRAAVDAPPWPGSRSSTDEAALPRASSMAVLRFQNIGGDPAARYFSDGLGEQLLTFLSNFTEFQIAARSSSWPLSDRGLDVPTIAEQLQVEHLLEGSVQRNAEQIRVWAQLVTKEGFHVWSHTFDRELTVENVFDIQDEIARHVVEKLKVVLSDESVKQFGQRPTESLEALDLFLRGREYLRGVHDEASLTAAVELFDRAVDIDPNFAAVLANMCLAYLYFYELNSSGEHFESAEKSCHRAITRDSSLEIAYTALGSLYRRSGQLETSEQYLRKALEIDPRSGEALYALARTREGLNDIDEARRLLQRAIELQPGYWFTHNTMGTFHRRHGTPEEAIAAFSRVIELVPDRAVGYVNLAAAHSQRGEFDKALNLYQQSLTIEPTRAALTNIGLTYYRLGRYDDAVAQQRLAIEMAPADHRAWGRIGDAHRHAGNESEAIAAYESALALVKSAIRINPNNPRHLAARARYEVCINSSADVARDLGRALELAPTSHAVHTLAAKVHLYQGKYEEALQLLRKALDLGESPHYLEADPDLAMLKDSDVFVAMLRAERRERR